jgi:phage-related protein
MMLHVFVKKTEKTPARELEIARKLMKVLLDV